MAEAIDLIKAMLTDLEAWLDTFPGNPDTSELINRAKLFLEENNG